MSRARNPAGWTHRKTIAGKSSGRNGGGRALRRAVGDQVAVAGAAGGSAAGGEPGGARPRGGGDLSAVQAVFRGLRSRAAAALAVSRRDAVRDDHPRPGAGLPAPGTRHGDRAGAASGTARPVHADVRGLRGHRHPGGAFLRAGDRDPQG